MVKKKCKQCKRCNNLSRIDNQLDKTTNTLGKVMIVGIAANIAKNI